MHRAGATLSKRNHPSIAIHSPHCTVFAVNSQGDGTKPNGRKEEHSKWFAEKEVKPVEVPPPKKSGSEFDWEKASLRGVAVAGNYVCGPVIGRGSFGTIRLGHSQSGNLTHNVAIKMEKVDKFGGSPCLDKEFKYLRRLQKTAAGIPSIVALTTLGPYRALVMQLLGKKGVRISSDTTAAPAGVFLRNNVFPRSSLVSASVVLWFTATDTLQGPNLQELFERCGKLFSVHCVALVALQLIDRFEYLHSERILYRDVKGENFLIGYPGSRSQNTVHVVDFGLARDWSKNPYEKRSPAGTPRYMSLRTHMGKQPSYRDDLESLSFLFVYLAKGKLPWQGIQDGNTIGRIKRIGIKKGSVSPEELCEGLPGGFGKFLKAARSLSYESRGDYNSYRSTFRAIIKEESSGVSGPLRTFDWLEQKVSLEHAYGKKDKKKGPDRCDPDQGDHAVGDEGNGCAKNFGRDDADTGNMKLGSDFKIIPVGESQPGVNLSMATVVTKDQPPAFQTADINRRSSPWGCLAFFKSLLVSEKSATDFDPA